MTITNSSTRLAVIAASVAVAAGLIGAVAIAPAQAASLSSTQVQAIVNLLQSFGADSATIANVTAALSGQPTSGGSTGGSTAGACPALARDLQQGSSGSDVMALQAFLNASADTRVSVSGAGAPGLETSTFGPATKAAVVKFQIKFSITPAAGYVGPVTRTKIVSVCGGAPGTPGAPAAGLQGGEGSLKNINVLSDTDTSLSENEDDQKVLGAEMTADDSDIKIERVDVDVKNHTGNGSSRLTNYIQSVSLWLDGKKLATIDADEITRSTATSTYSFRFSNLSGIIREDDKGKIYATVDVIANMDSTDDDDTWDFNIPQNGIRAVDAAGISETYISATDSTTITKTVSFNTESNGILKISAGSNNPLASLVTVASTSETKNVKFLEFKVKAENQDVTIHDLAVTLTSAGNNVNAIVKRVHLMEGSTVLDTETISTGATTNAVTFADVEYALKKDETKTFTIALDIADADSGAPDNNSTLSASSTNSLTGWDVEDAAGRTLTEGTDITGNAGGNTMTFFTKQGVLLTHKSSTAVKTVGSIAGTPDQVEFTIKFSAQNNGSDTVYLDGDQALAAGGVASSSMDGFAWATTTDSSTGTTSGAYGYSTAILSPDVTDTNDTTNSGDKRFEIEAGETRNFTFKVTINSGGDNVAAGAKLTGFKWSTTNGDSMDNLYTFNLNAFQTETVTGLNIQ